MIPPKGSTDHLLRSTPTTSMCATSRSALEGSATALLRNRATSALRPDATSRISGVMPSLLNIPARYFAAACSFPGGFVVLILTSSTSQSCASRASADVSPTRDGATGIPYGGGACLICARTTAPSPTNRTNTTTIEKLTRFQLTTAPPV